MNNDAWDRGLEMLDAVYGVGSSEMMTPYRDNAFTKEITENQFARVWADEAMSIREKRLMVIGATAMLGRADLIEVQVAGAIANGELTEKQLDFIPLFLLFYVGAPNATPLFRGIEAAKARAKEISAARSKTN